MRYLMSCAVAACLLASPTIAQPAENMVVFRAGERPGMVTPSPNFTGTVYIERAYDNLDAFASNGVKVTFLPGSRSFWHSHPAGQVLIVTEGIGWVQERGGQRMEMRAGDVVWTPPGVVHWHGGSATNGVTHYGIQQYENGRNILWQGPVSDEEYIAGENQASTAAKN